MATLIVKLVTIRVKYANLFTRTSYRLLLYRNMSLTDQYEYVKTFEKEDKCLPNSWIVVRIDGKSFSRFSEIHNFEKPNDKRALELMTRSAAVVMEEFRDICIAYGESDEYSFVFRKDTSTFNRRVDSLMSTVNSVFTSAYVLNWTEFFAYTKLVYPPSFDSRVVVYPSDTNIRDYLSWRQADTHINNLYNTVFWALVLKGNYSKQKAQEFIKTTVSSQKHEILFHKFGINYNNEPEMFKKGTVLIRKLIPTPGSGKLRQYVVPLNCDIIGDQFWKEHPEILGLKPLQIYHKPLSEPAYLINSSNIFISGDSVRNDGSN